MSLIEVLSGYRKAFFNWPLVIAALALKKHYIKVKPRFLKNRRTLRFRVAIDHNRGGMLFEVFGFEPYKFLAESCDLLVDIGANIADSSIYFALNGAQKVIAIEPFPVAYTMAKENIAMNGLSDKIELYRAGYGYDSQMILGDYTANPSSQTIPSDSGVLTEMWSLEKILKDKVGNKIFLKMDCEGCEYNLVHESDDNLRLFDKIQIEYHYGSEKIISKLKQAGFKVTTDIQERKPEDIDFTNKVDIGYIYAENLKTSID
jgi:FkbM family methyltransferase